MPSGPRVLVRAQMVETEGEGLKGLSLKPDPESPLLPWLQSDLIRAKAGKQLLDSLKFPAPEPMNPLPPVRAAAEGEPSV